MEYGLYTGLVIIYYWLHGTDSGDEQGSLHNSQSTLLGTIKLS